MNIVKKSRRRLFDLILKNDEIYEEKKTNKLTNDEIEYTNKN